MVLFPQFFRSFLLLNIVVDHYLFAVDAQSLETNFPASTAIDGSSERLIQLRMLGALPTSARLTQCTGFVLPSTPIYVTQIKGYAPSTTVHHMAVYGCNTRPSHPCSCPLKARSTIFVSTLNTPAIRFPSAQVGQSAMMIGGSSNIQYVFIEVHYVQALLSPDSTTGIDLRTQSNAPYVYFGIYSIMGVGTIDPGQSQFKLDTCVQHQGDILLVSGYQVHTHSLGTMVSLYDNYGSIVEIGRGNPQFPQAFYPYRRGTSFSLYGGDLLMLRCVYDTVGLSSPVYTIGVTGKTGTEMCFINLLYYKLPPAPPPPTNPFVTGSCTQTQSNDFPASSYTPFTTDSTNVAKLQLHALYGNQTGIAVIDSTHTMDFDLETFI